MRVTGDSAGISGLYLRSDLRIPTGSADLYPYAWESLDGGAGLEARGGVGPFAAAGSATYTLAGRRETSRASSNENYFLLAAGTRLSAGSAASLEFFAAGQFFRGGGYREVYMLTLETALSEVTMLRLSGAIDSGDAGDRVFNSMVSVSLAIRFPSSEANETPAGSAPPDMPPGL